MKRLLFVFSLVLVSVFSTSAENSGIKNNEFNPIYTGVNSLGIAPDARGGGMGDLGVATDPDVNSQFWNPSKYAFAYSSAGVSFSYTPWLRKLVNDINLLYLSGYWKFGNNDLQAMSASLRYFSLGSITLTDNIGAPQGSINPYEMALDLGYSRKLSEKFSMGVVFRYIYSDLGYSPENDVTGASAFAADISGYYTTYPVIGRSECQWSWGFNFSNIGSKIAYDGGNNNAFIPTNFRLGTSFLFPLAEYNTLSLNVDFNKLLVPAMPQRSNFETGDTGEANYKEEQNKYNNTSSISGIFKSFGDAPGGFKEELREINYSIGAEYAYNQQFFLRAGYFNENKFKGNRKYFTFGAGFALNVFRLDVGYVLATAQTSPLDQTLRFTLSFDMDGIKELIGRRR